MNETDLPKDLLTKILFIQESMDKSFRLILNPKWKSAEPGYRELIRHCLVTRFSSCFSRQQIAQLSDLNWVPETSQGHISISHCRAMGGFSYAEKTHGLDIEEFRRISLEVIKRTSTEAEYIDCPQPEFLWVAKEAGFKALSASEKGLVITDLVTSEWKSHYENQVFSFRLKSQKTLEFSVNKGFVFRQDHLLFGIFFK